MTSRDARQSAIRAANHVFEWLLPEISQECDPPPSGVAFLVASSAMSPTDSYLKQIRHLSKPDTRWDPETVSPWASRAAEAVENAIKRFEGGASFDLLKKTLNAHQLPSPMVLVETKEELQRHIEALLVLHGGELSYYDYVRERELLLVCVVKATVWR